MPLDSFVIPVKVDTSQVSKGLRGVSNQFKNLSTQLKSTGQALTLGLTAPLALLGRQFVKTASDAEETQAKFSAVFKELTSEAEDFVQATAQELGRSTNDLRAFMGTLQDTFVPLGFARDQGLEMSKALTKLTLDLASFNNMAQPEVLRALQSAIVGNHETVRRFGVIINQTVLSQELMNMGIKDGAKNATEAQKAQARLNIIIKGTSDAQGDALRTAGSFANQVRRLSSQFEEFAVEIGNIVIPVINKIIGFFGDLIQKFKDLSGEQKVLVVALGTILVALGPIMTALGAIISPIGIIITSFIALGKVVYDNSEVILDNLVAIINNFIELYNKSLLVRGVVQSLFFVFKTVFGAIQTGIKTVVDLFKGLGNIILSVLKGDFSRINEIFNETFSKIGDNVKGFGEDVANNFTQGIDETINGKLEFVTKEGIKSAISNSIDGVRDFILEKAKQFGFAIPQKIAEGIKEGKEVVQDATTEVAKVSKEVGESFQRITEQVVVSFAQMAVEGQKSIGEIIHEIGKMIKSLVIAYVLNTLIKGIFTGGLASIDLGKLLGLGAIMFGVGTVLSQATPTPKGEGIPQMAKGGIVTGPTLAMIGEAGAEAVIPLNRLDRMTGGQSKGEFVLRGQDLILALERAGDFRARVTG
jgi:methyl-accepting chemotaxis protein